MKRVSNFLRLTLVCAATSGAFGQTASVAEILYDSAPNLLKFPDDIFLGEAVGVATNSKGDVFVYTRTGSNTVTLGTNRAFVRGGARLFQFNQNGRYIREIGQGLYGLVFAHTVRVDPQDNIWVVDQGANMIIKFDPEGRVLMAMGRKPEAIQVPARPPAAPAPGATVGAGVPGDNFNGPTDVGWDSAGNIFIADGHGNSRVAKFDKNGQFIKSWGSKGPAPGQFDLPHALAVDFQGNVYVGDRGNKRIQIFDNDGNFKTAYTNVGAPWALCISAGPHPYLFSSNSNGIADFDSGGEIYKMELDGKLLGKFGTPGKLMKQFGSVHALDCRNPNEIYVGEITNWRVQKLTLRASQSTSQTKN